MSKISKINKKRKSGERAVPKAFRTPAAPITALLILCAVSLGIAAALRNSAVSTAEYTCTPEGIIRTTLADRFGGAVMAVLLILTAGIAVFLIIGTVLRAGKNGVFPALEIFGDLALLAAAAAVVLFSLSFARGEKPKSSQRLGLENDLVRMVFLEEEYRNQNTLSIYTVDDDMSASQVLMVELGTLSENIEERYSSTCMGNRVEISFYDTSPSGVQFYRTLSFDIPE